MGTDKIEIEAKLLVKILSALNWHLEPDSPDWTEEAFLEGEKVLEGTDE